MVDRIEQMLFSQCMVHQIYCGTAQSPERMIDLLERGPMYPPLVLCVDALAVYDAIAATDACEPAESSLKFHLTSVRDRTTYGAIPMLCCCIAQNEFSNGRRCADVARYVARGVCH